jgi:hypothetical protein
MDDAVFWSVIESAVAAHDDREGREQALTTALSALPPDEIVDFQVLLDDASTQARTWLMWGAAHRIFGWCSDDGFDYFRMWLLSLGGTAFAQVVTEPDRLARLPQVIRLSGRERGNWTSTEWPEWETLDYVADTAYRSLTGQGIYDAVDRRATTRPHRQFLHDERWDFDDTHQATARLPRLVALFPTTDLQRRQAFDRHLADRGLSAAAFHFGTDATETASASPDRTRAWLRQWRPVHPGKDEA